MKKCDCEHWETCMICYPQGFDAQGKRKPVEVPPSREELQTKVAELTKERDEAQSRCAEGMVVVTKEDAENYCRLLTILGMEEEGSPVEEVERLIALREGMTCADCNDTGWLENRVEGKIPCTCMTEVEPYQLLQAKLVELTDKLKYSSMAATAEAQYANELKEELTRAEAVIEKCNLALELNVPLLTTRLAAIFAIAAYREGK